MNSLVVHPCLKSLAYHEFRVALPCPLFSSLQIYHHLRTAMSDHPNRWRTYRHLTSKSIPWHSVDSLGGFQGCASLWLVLVSGLVKFLFTSCFHWEPVCRTTQVWWRTYHHLTSKQVSRRSVDSPKSYGVHRCASSSLWLVLVSGLVSTWSLPVSMREKFRFIRPIHTSSSSHVLKVPTATPLLICIGEHRIL